jgi:hypothetical protein
MIGRWARSLGWKPHAPIVAGAILAVLGIWQGGAPLFATYPAANDLTAVTGTGQEVVELTVQSAGVPFFESGPLTECRVILEPGAHAVLYRSVLPDYTSVCDAFSGEVTVMMWPTAPDAFDRTLAWGAASGDVTLVTADAVIEAFKNWRNDRIILGAVLLGLGFVAIVFGLIRWSQIPREGPGRG